jgi:hypothetical protein
LTIHFKFDSFEIQYITKEGYLMEGLKKIFLLLLIFSLVTVSLYSTVWAGDKNNWARDDTVGQQWSTMDIFLARPLGVIAGILGTGVFIVSLPFTIPTGAVGDAANMFIVQPFQFSFTREFPDEDI